MPIALLLALFVLGADQLTKYLVVSQMSVGQSIPVIEGVLNLHYVRNTGAAFSMLQGQQWIFIVASSIASVAIVVFLARKTLPLHWFGLLSLGLILGGAIGNLFDRLRNANNEVIDFIHVSVKAINFDFAVFNVADSAVTVGAILLCVYILFVHEKFVKKGKAVPEKPEEPDGEQAQG